MMTIGLAYNQSLNHAVTLGAVAPSIQKRKVVILLSPTWFYREGVLKDHYSFRYSENEYIKFMENKNIPKSLKRKVAKRTNQLLKGSGTKLNFAKMEARVNGAIGKTNSLEKLAYNIRKAYIMDRDILTVKMAMLTNRAETRTQVNPEAKKLGLNWDALVKRTQSEVKGEYGSNPYYIQNSYWYKFKKVERKGPGSHKNDSWAKSREYKDLKLFLEVCKANNIEAKVIKLPVNGYWYDFTGMTKAKRAKLSKNLAKLTSKYDCEYYDMSKYDYTKYFFEDVVHPSDVGWVRINEEIYKFYK